ncbi:hypothetical protein WN55_10479 [Dufourea novaeangliae]|uniref:Uncharacterized protein n=1 Tax=Dufourea novaeangliae TaxID=178035 RepID=A0A154P5U5_DUFNO|nr:hypothetical protein WN55_10479 [Dufourea novaeangliae]
MKKKKRHTCWKRTEQEKPGKKERKGLRSVSIYPNGDELTENRRIRKRQHYEPSRKKRATGRRRATEMV